MPLPTNPQTLATYNLLNGGQAKVFVKNVSDILVAIYQIVSNPASFANLLNGTGLIKGSALAPSTVSASNLITVGSSLGSVGTNQTVDCTGAYSVCVDLTITAALTLTLTNLNLGTVVGVTVANSTAGALVFKMAGSDPSSAVYVITGKSNAVTIYNVGTTGLSIAANQSAWFFGNSLLRGGSNTLRLGQT